MRKIISNKLAAHGTRDQIIKKILHEMWDVDLYEAVMIAKDVEHGGSLSMIRPPYQKIRKPIVQYFKVIE